MSTVLDVLDGKITTLEAKVDAASATQAEAATELKALRSDLATALASNDTAALTALGARIDAVTGKLDASSAALAAVEVPAAPAPATEPTVPPIGTP